MENDFCEILIPKKLLNKFQTGKINYREFIEIIFEGSEINFSGPKIRVACAYARRANNILGGIYPPKGGIYPPPIKKKLINLDNNKNNTKNRIIPINQELIPIIEKYIKFLNRIGALKKKINKNNWYNYFTKINKIGYDNQEIIKLVEYYISHYKEKYIPVCFSARSLYQKIERLEQYYNKNNSINTNKSNKNSLLYSPKNKIKYVPSDKVKSKLDNLSLRLKLLRWPKNSDRYFPEVVYQSYRNWKNLHNLLKYQMEDILDDPDTKRKLAKSPLNVPILYRTIESFYDSISNYSHFLEYEWFKRLQEQLLEWKEWEPNFVYMTFNVKNKLFHSYGERWICNKGNFSSWKEFWEKIN